MDCAAPTKLVLAVVRKFMDAEEVECGLVKLELVTDRSAAIAATNWRSILILRRGTFFRRLEVGQMARRGKQSPCSLRADKLYHLKVSIKLEN